MEQKEHQVSELIEEGGEAEWIVTYADLMTLLLVFFILLYSISSLDMEKFKHAIASIQVSLGETNPPVGILELVGESVPLEKKISLEDLTGLRFREQEMLKDINKIIEKKKLGEHIVLSVFQGKIIIQIRGKIIYESGLAKFNNEANPILDDIVKLIDKYSEYNVNIKGHTDDIPIATERFPSNWDLSAIRATTVLRHLIESGIDPARLTATGYGGLLPLVPNDTEENRAINRRVEFVLEKKAEQF